MRCKIGEKKIKKYREQTGLPVVSGLVRGGTNHRIDLLLEDGTIMEWYRDGSMEKSDLTWDIEKWKKKKLMP